MPEIDRGSHRIHYEIHGKADAPPLLLIMGLSLSSRSWHRLPAKLEHAFRVITFDNAGTGRSSSPPTFAHGLPEMADDAAAVLDAAGVEIGSVFGISMGGMIAIELALRHAQRVRRLVLGATHAGFLRSEKPSPATIAMLATATFLPGRFSPRTLARFLTSEAHYARDPETFESWLAEMEPADAWTALRQTGAILRHAADERLDRIRVPTLIISGDQDALVPIENARRLARKIEGARLIELRETGHCFPVERAAEVVAALEEFLLAG